MNQPVARTYSKQDLQHMVAPMVAATRRTARRCTIAIMVVGFFASIVSVQQRWIVDDASHDALQVAVTFLLVAVPTALYARARILSEIDRLPVLIRTGSLLPARLTSSRNVGKLQRVGVTWTEGGNPAGGHIDVLDLLGYVARDTTVLADPKNRCVAIVLNDRLYVGRRSA